MANLIDPIAAGQLAAARDQAGAAWAAVRAAWTADAVTVIAASATLAAVVSAFRIQKQQARDDRALALEQREFLLLQSAEAAFDAADAMIDLHAGLEEDIFRFRPELALPLLTMAQGVADHYLGRDLPSVHVVGALVVLRPHLAASLNDLHSWQRHTQAMVGMSPEEFRTRLRNRLPEVEHARDLLLAQLARQGISVNGWVRQDNPTLSHD